MASSATLGFSIISRYSGGGVAQARRDLAMLRTQMATLNGDLQRHTTFLSGIPARWRAIGIAAAAVAPAMLPIGAAALQVAASFTSMAAAVGVALGAYGAAMTGAIKKTMEMAKAGKALSPVQKEFVSSVNGMNTAWRKFISDTQGMTLTTASAGVRGLTAGIGLLLPIVKAIHPEVLKMAQAFEAWMKGDSAKNYSNLIAAAAVPALRNLVAAGRDVLNVLGDGFRAFLPLGVRMTETIRSGAAALREWSDGGGFQRFLAYVKENGPAVNRFWDAFRAALSNIFSILGQFSDGSLSVLTDALRGIAAINPESVKAFAQALLLMRSPILFLVLNCPPLRDAMIALLGALNPATIYAIAAAFMVWRVAILAVNAGLISSPIGWVITALAALAVAIVWIATQTTWFQTAWQYTWNFIKTVGEAIWNALKIAWQAFVGALQTAWTAVSGALVTAWNAVWNGIATAVQVVWTGLQVAWSAFTGALATAWSAVSGALVAAWNAVWNGISTAAQAVWTALQVAWSAFVGALATAWTAVSGALTTAWNAVWTGLSTAATAVWNGIQAAWSAFVNALATVWSTVSSALVAAWSAVWNGIRTAAEAVWNALKTAWQAVVTFFSTVWSSFSGALSSAWSATWNGIRAAGEAVWNALRTAWTALWNAFRTIWDTFRSWFHNSWTVIWNLIKSAAQAVWNAMKTAWQAFLNAFRTIWDTVRAWFYNSWTVLWNIVKSAAQAVWNFLKSAWQTFLNAIKSIWDAVRSWFYNSWTTLWNIVRDAAKAVWDWLKDKWQGFVDGVKSIWDKFRSWFYDSWTGIWNLVRDVASDIWHEIGEIIEKAINAVIGIINGLIKGFNKITSFLKIDVKVGEIGKVNFNFAEGGMVGLTPYMIGGMAEFAKGGTVNLKKGGTLSGYAPGRDTVPAMLSRGEGVLTPEAVRGLGGPGFVNSANRTFAGHRGAGRGAPTLNRFSGSHDAGMGADVQHFAIGGLVSAALARAGVSAGMVSQGEYSNGSLSAGTHAGGGVVDISSTSPALVAALRAAGFAAWARTGPAWAGNEHIHAVLMNHPDLSGPARAQVADFLKGGDGLGAGGGGGGGIDILGMVKGHVGKILKNVYGGKSPLANIGGAIAQFFGIGSDEDDGGLFGTGIGPDIGPNVADAVGNVVESVTGIGGQMMEMLGQVVLAALDKGSILEGLSDAGDKFKKEGGIAGGFGQIAFGLGKKILEQIMPDFLMSKKDESTFNPADFAGGFGNVQSWAPLALQALARAGISSSQLPRFLALMQAESGGNPMAMNNWDSNALMGQASRGLMQVIPGTFAMYRDRSLPNNIFDPLANMTAAANYIKNRYGGQVPGSPYALGTPGATSGVHLVGEQGPELLNFRGGETVTPAKETAGILGGQQVPEDLMERFKLLMSLSQEMASIVQSSWTKVTTSGKTAQSSLTPVFTDVANQLGTNVPTAMTTMQTANSTAWTTMSTDTATAWTAMRDGTFTEANDHMMVKMPTWGQEMNTAVSTAWVNMGDATATAWEGMKEGTRGPTNWIIDNSYNNGIRSLWNQVAEVIFEDGAKTLPSVATLAKGGPVHGPGGERADRVPAMLSRGEHVWTAREVHRAGGHHAVQAMRQGVMGRGVRGAHSGRGFALGGWLAGVGSVSGSSPAVGTLDLKRGSMMDVVGDHLDQIDASVKAALDGSFYRRMGGSAGVTSPTDWIRQYVEKDDELNKIGSGGPPWVPGVSDAITSWGGVTVNQRTADMLNMAMALGASFSATQGSFSTGVAASAGTHDGGGVVDLVPASNTNVGALRAVGFAAWNRGAAWGSPSFSDHIHAVALGDPTVSSGAAAQVMSYLAGGNGLANGGPDNYSGGIPSVDGVAAIGGGRNVDPADLSQNVVSYDRGGYLQPGYTLAFNGTGKPEPVGHNLEPKGSSGISINMPITITGNANAQEVVAGIESQVLPKLRQALTKGTGNN